MTVVVKQEDSTGQVVLRMRGISKSFGPVKALDCVDLAVRRGAVHALVGENGAGKSTLMKILAGVYRPDAGRLELSGREVSFADPHSALAAGISMIYQDLDLAEHLTVAENLYLGAEPAGMLPFTIDRAKMTAAASNLAGRFGFSIDPGAVVADLSTGNCQVVEILKALARDASIIVMDEPTSSLSENEAAELFAAVRLLRDRGICVIYISHRLEEIVDLADEVTVLRDGRVVHWESGSRPKITRIIRHMVGRELTEFFPRRNVQQDQVRVTVEDLCVPGRVCGASFGIRAGEVVGMAGLVGAGRTDLAEAVFGARRKWSGKVTLDGRRLFINGPSDAIAGGIALLTEDRKRTGLCLNLPCSWNVTLAALDRIGMRHLVRPALERSKVQRLARRLDIRWSGPDAPASSLSGGNQQKLLIARWLLADSKFIIFDEPTRGIDVGAKKEVYGLVNELAAEGRAILFISSELPELLGVTDRILVMRRGRLVADIRTAGATQEQIMHLAAVEQIN